MASLFTNPDVAMTTVIDNTSYLATDHPSPPREGSPLPIPSWEGTENQMAAADGGVLRDVCQHC